ncbi:hypothetical protein B0H13DRAFT_1862860 [Mycena leptocephala]|nr:hypothetical protein B0H13DRAFT_1862860 [Mycena leptocephala]
MPSVCDDPYDPRGVVRDTLDHIRVPPCSPSTSKPPAHTWSRIHDQRLGALRALTAFESSAASPRPSAESDAMHWVERGVLSLPMPSFDDDTREDYSTLRFSGHALMLKREPAGERLNQFFIPSTNGRDKHTFGKKSELSGGSPLTNAYLSALGINPSYHDDVFAPSVCRGRRRPKVGTFGAITLIQQLWKSVRRRHNKPDWPLSPSLDSWSLSEIASTPTVHFLAALLQDLGHPLAYIHRDIEPRFAYQRHRQSLSLGEAIRRLTLSSYWRQEFLPFPTFIHSYTTMVTSA